jgi:competence protein ComEC
MDHLCRYVKSIRQYFYNKLQRYDDPTSYWLKTFILSERSALPSPIQEDFKVTGLQHLLALSGGHIVIVLVFFQMLLRWPLNAAYTARCVTMRCWPLLCKWAHSTSILCTLIYSLTAGFGGPLQRATVTLLVREIFMVKGIEASKLQIIKIALFVNIAMFPIGFLNIGSFLSWIGSIYLVGQLKPKISLGHSMIVAIKHQLFFCVLSTFIFSQMNLSSIITNLVLALLISSVTYLDLWLTFVISPEWNFIANVGNEIHKVFLELIAMLGDFSQAFTPTPISIHPTLLHFALVCLALFLLSRLNDHA